VGLDNVATARGSEMRMSCEAKAESDVKIKWRKGSEDLTSKAVQQAYSDVSMTRSSVLTVEGMTENLYN
jgi:hypothetical protein